MLSSLAAVGRALFRPQNRGLTAPIDPRFLQRFIPYAQLLSGIQLTMDEALQLSAVWACVDAISKAIASCRWGVFTFLPDGRRKYLPNDPLVYLLNVRPNPDMTAASFRRALLTNALLEDCGYAEIVKDNGGNIRELWPLPARWMQPMRDPETGDLCYRYTPLGVNARAVLLSDDRVFRVQGGPTLTGLMGDQKVARAARVLGLSIATHRHAESYYGNGTRPGGVFEHPGTMGTGPAGKAAQERFLQGFAERNQGPDQSHRPIILEENMKWHPYESDAEKAQLVEARKFQVEEIARFFGVPPHRIGHLEKSTNNNIEQQGLEFVRDGLTPWALELEQEAEFKLFSPRSPKSTKLDMAWLTAGDAKSRAEANSIKRYMGYSLNEIKHAEGEDGVGPIGDTRIVNAGVQNLEAVAKATMPPAPKPAAPAPEKAAA